MTKHLTITEAFKISARLKLTPNMTQILFDLTTPTVCFTEAVEKDYLLHFLKLLKDDQNERAILRWGGQPKYAFTNLNLDGRDS